jgi:hypothetical protein
MSLFRVVSSIGVTIELLTKLLLFVGLVLVLITYFHISPLAIIGLGVTIFILAYINDPINDFEQP